MYCYFVSGFVGNGRARRGYAVRVSLFYYSRTYDKRRAAREENSVAPTRAVSGSPRARGAPCVLKVRDDPFPEARGGGKWERVRRGPNGTARERSVRPVSALTRSACFSCDC